MAAAIRGLFSCNKGHMPFSVFHCTITDADHQPDLRTEWKEMRGFFEERLAFPDETIKKGSF